MASTLPLTGDGDISINSSTPSDGNIKLTNSGSGAGKTLTIEGSNAGSGNNNGGNIVLTPGTKSGTGTDGNVGIGTTIPISGQGRSLHLASDSDHATFRVEAGSTKDSQIQLANNGALKWNLYNSNSSSDKLFLDTASINVLAIQQNGNVGIGTTSPSYPLDVSGRSRIRGAASWGGGLWLTTSGNPTSDYSFIGRGTDAEAFLGLYNNGGWRLVIDDSSAKVGIGNTSPSSMLDVSGDIEIGSADAFYFGAPTATVGSWRVVRSGNDLLFQRCTSTGPDVWTTKSTISG